MSTIKYHDDLNDEAWNAFSEEENEHGSGKKKGKLSYSRKKISLELISIYFREAKTFERSRGKCQD